MLEGLEISILNLSEVKNSIEDFRIHSEFFKKEFLENEIKLKSFNSLALSTYSKISDGDHSKFPDNQKREVRYLQARDINNNFLEITSDVFISKSYLEKNKRSLLKGEDILISIMGTVGDITILPKGFQPAMCNRALAIVKNIKGISPQFLFTYLTTKFAFIEIKRLKNGGVQQRLNLDVLSKIRIPKLDSDFQKQIEIIILKAQETKANSKSIYKQSEKILLQEIGLQDFTPSREPVNIKSFNNSFAKSGRLDAEFYQPKYDDYLKLTESYSNGSKTIATICNLKGKNYKPEDKKQYKYIELSNVGKTGDINGFTVNFGKELPSRARRKVNTGDVIISSIEGSLESCALVTKEYNNALCSTGFYVINSDFINSESLLVLFKSELMQNVLKQNCSGTILTGLNKDDFLNIKIPKIIESKQQQIAGFIEQSFTLKKQSEYLLEVAKKAVEIAIEESEENAIKYINSSKES